MIGLKIATTGVIFFLLATWAIVGLGRNGKMPTGWIAVPLLVCWFCGLLAAVGGTLWWVWS